MKRQHAIIVMADGLYYSKFREYCGPGIEADKNCIADEHYLPTFFNMIDPMGISNWSVTFVDWSERRWHPKTYGGNEISLEFMKNVTVCFKTQSFRKMSQSTSYYTFLFSRLCSPRT
jgi:hypothetical protein